MIRRLITKNQAKKIKVIKKFKNRDFSQLSNKEKDELLQLIAEKLDLL